MAKWKDKRNAVMLSTVHLDRYQRKVKSRSGEVKEKSETVI